MKRSFLEDSNKRDRVHSWKIRITKRDRVHSWKIRITKRDRVHCWKIRITRKDCRSFLEPGNKFQIDDAWSESLRHRIYQVGEVFDEQVGNGILPVYHIEYFQRGPDIVQFSEGVMTPAVRFIVVHEQCTESDIRAYIWINDQRIAVFHTARHAVGQV